jgi:hypothetical protein
MNCGRVSEQLGWESPKGWAFFIFPGQIGVYKD